MRTPKVNLPPEDPATKAAREREQRRAENSRTEETQALLLGDTVRRLRRFGRVGSRASSSVPIYGGGSGGVTAGSGGRGSLSPGGSGAGTGGLSPGRDQAVLY